MTAEVVPVFARWWDNFQESCDVRLAAGCGCAAAWVLLVAISPVLSTTSSFLEGGLSWRLCTTADAAVAFGAVVLAERCKVIRSGSLLAAPSLLAAGATLSVLGAVLHRSSEAEPVTAIAGLCVGWGLAGLALGWAAPFAAMRLRKRVVGTVASVFVGGALYLIVVAFPHPVSWGAALSLPVISLILGLALNRNGTAATDGNDHAADSPALDAVGSAPAPVNPSNPATDSPSESKRVRPMRLFGSQLATAAVIYGSLFVLAGHVLPEAEPVWMTSPAPGIANIALFLALEVVLTVYMVRCVRRENPRVAYRPATICAASGFLLLPFAGRSGALMCAAIAFAGFSCFLVYFWVVMGNISQRWRTSPGETYGSGLFLVFAGFLAGEGGAWAIHNLLRPDFGPVATISIVALFLLVVVAWNMTDGSQFAHETTEMGGVPFPGSSSSGASNGDGAAANSPEIRLAQIAEAYGLSPREMEVAALLLRGRSIPYICDELFIAKSTAQTHVRHIYAKMGITGGRQELIDRIESAGEPQAPSQRSPE